jgi:plasmid stabilization system protein ParE
VKLTPQARSDLQQILLDIAEDSPDAALVSVVNFRKLFRPWRSLPELGYHEELLSRKYRFWNFYSYVVAYVWEAKPIQVVCVVHGSRDLAVFLSQRTSLDD